MTAGRLVINSFAYYWRSHLGAIIAAAVGTAVLTGALLVGDSVKHSLMAMIGQRLGSTQCALISGDRLFRDDLGARVAAQPEFSKTFTSAHAVLMMPGLCIRNEGTDSETRAPMTQIIGVGDDFWKLGSGGPSAPPARGEIVINESLANKLGAVAGDSIAIHINKPGVLPLDAPMGGKKESYVFLRATIKEIVRDRGLGRFGLSSNQAAPLNLFVPIAELQNKLGQKGRANMLLIAGPDVPQAQQKDAAAAADNLLQSAWNIDDAELRIRSVPAGNELEIYSPRVFLDDSLSDALIKEQGARGITTYFVNWIRNDANKHETPYSMVCAIGAPLFDENSDANEIVLNDWEQSDLDAKDGDSITLQYCIIGLKRKLEGRETRFKVKQPTVSIKEPWAGDPKLMPEFPGISEAETTEKWDAGIPIDRKKIRDVDEKYWKQYRGTPKAFIPLKKGVELWKNRFGSYTALRVPIKGDPETEKTALAENLRAKISPKILGLALMPVKFHGLQAAANGTDFSGLFLGFSFFLIAAAVLLMALIFQFAVESRAREIGLLLAVGFTPGRVRLLFWAEGVLLAAIGAAFGVFGAIIYAQTLLNALATRWHDAVGTSALEYYAEPPTLIIGCVASVIVAAIAVFLAIRKQAALPARELLAASRGMASPSAGKRGAIWSWVGIVCGIGAVGLVVQAVVTGKLSNAELFFSAGSLALIATLMLVRRLLIAPSKTEGDATLTGLGIRAATRRRGRSLATSALLACGTFLVIAVGANKQDATIDAQNKTAGTGGFALYAQSTIPVFEDLNTPEGRRKAGVQDSTFQHVTIYPFRVKSGDEASCLNLNRAQQPKILGATREFMTRGGFSFAATLDKSALKDNVWELLKRHEGKTIPAICDDQSLTWALGLKLGDELTIYDEHGAPKQIQFVATLANSILQGSVIIDEQEFLKLYPSQSGYSAFLIDQSEGKPADLARSLSRALADEGFDPVPAADRLAQFNAVENTYLSTFQALGGLGMLLGSAGLGVVVLRNVLERRGELAVLRAIGFSRAAIGWLALSEHIWLLILGLAAGVISSLIAVVPALQSTTLPVPWLPLGITLGAILAVGLLSALAATWLMMRGELLAALRSE
jgi:ABC-type antimicrobial peptide transport system permease subunit